MKSKKDIVHNWLPRYTGKSLRSFGKYILLTNFHQYLNLFSKQYKVKIEGRDKPMPNVTADGVTLINFGIGSSNAATIIDLLIKKCEVLEIEIRFGEGVSKIVTNNDLYEERELLIAIFQKRFRPFRRSDCKGPYQKPLKNMKKTTGQAPCTQPIREYGSMTMILKVT